jgi:putative transposase
VIAIGGIDDHVHLLVAMPATLAPADLVKQVKGASSHLVNHGREPFFRWQGGYGAFSVSKHHVPRIRDYVLRQEEHHRFNRLTPELEPAPARAEP